MAPARTARDRGGDLAVDRVEQGVLGAEAWEEVGYRGPQVCAIVGITYRQLDYWARTGLVVYEVGKAPGSGKSIDARDVARRKLMLRAQLQRRIDRCMRAGAARVLLVASAGVDDI